MWVLFVLIILHCTRPQQPRNAPIFCMWSLDSIKLILVWIVLFYVIPPWNKQLIWSESFLQSQSRNPLKVPHCIHGPCNWALTYANWIHSLIPSFSKISINIMPVCPHIFQGLSPSRLSTKMYTFLSSSMCATSPVYLYLITEQHLVNCTTVLMYQ